MSTGHKVDRTLPTGYEKLDKLAGDKLPSERAIPTVKIPPLPREEAKAEPVPEKSNELFPHKAGSQWSLQEKLGTATNLVVLEVLKSVSGGPFEVETKRNGTVVLRESYEQSPEGLVRTKAGYPTSGTLDPPMLIIPSEIVAGKEWTWSGKLKYADAEVPGEASFTIDGPDEIKTPSETVQAFKVAQTFTLKLSDGKSVTVKNTQWFAPGVGPVKSLTESTDQKSEALLTGRRLK